MKLRLFSVVTSSAIALTAGMAWSQEAPQTDPGAANLGEVVVTAQRRSENLQRAAASVSVRSGEELEAEGKYALSAILEDVPGVSGGAAAFTAGSPYSSAGTDSPAAGLNIRGIPSNSGIGGSSLSVATSAAIYVDGVYSGVGGSYDINRVEVLRGPQGTLYGRSATTGVVTVRTNDPDLEQFGVSATAEAGNFAMRHVTGAVNVPLVDGKLALRLAGNYYDRDGYISEGDALTNKDLRAKLLYRPNENVSVLLGYAQQDNVQHSGGVTINAGLDNPNNFIRTTSPVGDGENAFRQYWAELNWSLGDMTLTYMPALRTWESSAQNIAIISQMPPIGSNQIINTPTDEFVTHELRLQSGVDQRLTWQVGATYYHNDVENTVVATSPFAPFLPQFSSDANKTTKAVGGFGEATYALSDAWRITAGLRYDQTEVQTTQTYTTPFGSQTLSGPAGHREFTNTTYKLRLEHDLTPQNLIYAMTATGFSPGDVGVTTGANGLPAVVQFDAETLTSYEIGSKNTFLDNRLRLNASAFYYDYGAYQVSSIATGTTPFGESTFSAISMPARAYGGEVEVNFQLTPQDLFALNLGYTRGDLLDTNSQVVPGSGGRTADVFFSSSSIPNIVPFTAQLSYDRFFDLSNGSAFKVRSGLRYRSAYDASALSQQAANMGFAPFVRVDEQVVGNVSATWSDPTDRYSVTAYVRNIGDNEHRTDSRIMVISPPAPIPPQISATTSLTEPMTFGIVLSTRL